MKRCNIKSFFKEGGIRTDELKSGVLLERDLNRCASAKAVTAAEIISTREEKEKQKTRVVKVQSGHAPVNVENLKKKWGEWYIFGMNEKGQYTAKCKACSAWYVGINKKEHPDGTPFKGYEYCKANVIKHGKQKLGQDGHLKDQENQQRSNRAHWRAVRGLATQQTLLDDQSDSYRGKEFPSTELSSGTSRCDIATPLRVIGIKPPQRKIEREIRGLEVLVRLAYITAKADMPISKFNILRNSIQQSQLTLLADSHERVDAICTRLNDFQQVVETQISGLKTLVDTNVPFIDLKQNKLKGFRSAMRGHLAQNVMKNAISELEETIKKQFTVMRKDIVDALTEILRDATHTSQRLATQGTIHGFTQQAFRRVFEAVRKQTLMEMENARGWTFMLDESTDLTVTKQLLITVKYYHVGTKKTRTRILDLSAIPDGKAETMLNAVWGLFEACELDLCYCYGIGADGASVNQGSKRGFIRLFLNKLSL